ncbi:zinc fingers and homeoboxes protein 3-like isoform X1 [Cyprinus carpio]|uniref:Zinc fingers and homeoboxes protein 3-like isoform X1 n=1 Tax=Cyprinus carpio TaxID=7962 RepID=A0A9Q9ZNW5_CYPCA|nr:zinc fingers and homeoboxes protein 3-like isoform X1 [Cyprinus carpio]XP_042568493.1 zinc fingers and homeoboxes protein 3-like isoform X1 [Cyprinus carpio]
MASKRKSTVPCMIPVKAMHLQDDFERGRLYPPAKDIGFSLTEEASGKSSQSLDESSGQEAGDTYKDDGIYTCRPCNFETQDLNLFLDHVYSGHPDFRIDPCFRCVDCGTSAAKFEGLALHNARVHPSTITTTLQLKKKDNRILVEQSLCVEPCESSSSKESEISITKTPIMKMLKGKSEPKRIVVSHPATDDPLSSITKVVEKSDSPAVTVTHVPTIVHNGAASKVALPSAIQIVNGSGALPMLKTAVTQVVSVVQNRSLNQHSAPITVSSSHSSSASSSSSTKNLPKVMIPLSSIPTYNASMDNSSFLKTSFSKFPYPTKAELCYLTVVTKYPEEQIKIWFTAQRLKQGISWSPEEIEDARRKMFNTIIQAAPSNSQQQRHTHHTTTQPTITVLGTTGIPHFLQGSLVGQGGVIVTQPMMANGIQVSSAPVALAVTPKPQAAAKHTMQARPAAALVADKGISMVLGTVGSSSSGNCSSSSSNASSSSSSISSTSSLCSQASVISIGSSSSNAKVNTPGTDATCIQSNGTIVKSESKGNSEVKSNINSKNSVSAASTTLATTSASVTTTDSAVPSKSDSPVSVNSRIFSNTNILDASFNKTKKSQEQLAALKESFLVSQFPNQEEVDRLISLTGLSVREVRKWFSDRRYHFRNLKGSRSSGGGQTVTASGSISQLDTLAAVDLSENSTPPERPKTPQQSPLSPSQTSSPPTPTRRPPRPPSPDFTAIRYKEREPHQVRTLEASFAQDPDPSSEEVDRLRAETKMTRREIHGWFAERRKRVAAEKKKEEAERAEREDNDAEEHGIKKEKSSNEETHEAEDSSKETQQEDQQKDESGTEPKVNPIKINLKMLKVTESNGKGEPEGSQLNEATKVAQSLSQTAVPQTSPYRGKKTPEQLHLLKQVFARTHWPSSPQYNDLITKTGLSRPEVVRWFGDCRYVLKNGQLKWLESYQTMVDEEDFQKANISILKEHLDKHGKLDETKLEEIVKSSGLGEESIRRWFANKMPLLLEESNSESTAGVMTGSSSATPTEAALASQHPDHDEVERSGSSLISKDQTTVVDISTSTKQGDSFSAI